MTDHGTSENRGPLAHRRILASAGSGKTYQLTNRFLALVHAGADPGSILASTFTRAAAGEIRNRVLSRLAEVVRDERERVKLAEEIGLSTMSRQEALTLLANLAREVHRLNIRTLDSFFASIVMNFALEMGIPPTVRMIDDPEDRQLRAEAMRQMLDETDPQELVDLLRQLTQGDTQRSVLNAITRAVGGLYELYHDTTPEAWDCIPQMPTLTEPEIAGFITNVETCTLPENKHFHNARESDLGRLYDRDWPALLKSGLAGVVGRGETIYRKLPLEEDVLAAYRPLVQHAAAMIVNDYRGQTLATRRLLELFDQRYTALKLRRGALTFADLTRKVCKANQCGKLAYIGYRIDASIQHLLLDEFQDTSVGQWNALKPFIDEVVASAPPDHTFFCVGDVKQSIYGWRGAVPDLLDDMPNHLEAADEDTLPKETLDKSRRSSPVIMKVVNDVFESISDNAALGDLVALKDPAWEPKHPDDTDPTTLGKIWTKWFNHHETAMPFDGYAQLHSAPSPANGDSKEEARLQAAADLIEILHRRAPGRKIGVLTRRNVTIAQLLFKLHEKGVPASGEGGGPLTDAAPVNVMLDLLQLADHPDDTAAAFHIASSPLATALGMDETIAIKSGVAARRRFSADIRRALLENGYANTIAGWTRLAAPHCDERQLRRLLQLVELAEQFDEEASLRPGDFIEIVEEKDIAQIRPAPVQLMTVHKAKGLQFDVVVLPELDSKVIGQVPAVVFERNELTGPITRISRYLNEQVRAFVPELQSLYDGYHYRTAREALCMLYVAMTRAQQGLYMIIDPSSKSEKALPKTLAGVLRHALVGGDRIEPDTDLYSEGDEAWLATSTGETTVIEDPPPIETPVALLPSRDVVRPGVTAASASMHAHAALGESLHFRHHEALERGSALHALFERVEWVETFTDVDATLDADLVALLPHRELQWRRTTIAEFRGCLERPEIHSALSLGGRDPALPRIWIELPYAQLADGSVRQGRIDRLVADFDESGKAIRAEIIDFKSDRIEPGEAAESAESYRHQLETYRDPVAQFLDLNPEAVTMTLLFITPGVRVNLT